MLLQIVLTILALYVLSKIVKFARQYRKWVEISSKVTKIGPIHPIWGNLHLFDDLAGYFRVVLRLVQDKRPKMFTGWVMFFYPVFATCHPDTAKLLLKSSEPKPKYHLGGSYRLFLPWLGDGLLLSDGKKWERNRRLLTPAFHFDILRPYVQTLHRVKDYDARTVQVYNEVTAVFLSKLQEACDAGQSIEIYKHVSLATLDTMLRCSLTYNGQVQQSGEGNPYVQAVQSLAKLTIARSVRPWLFPDSIYYFTKEGREFQRLVDFVHDFADKIIQSRRKTLDEDPSQLQKRKLDFLDILITAKDESGKGLSDMDIRAEVDTFLFEGHDTTASAISWAIYSLARYPEEQDIVYKEVQSLLGSRDTFQWDDLTKLSKMTMFIKEVLRMHSPVPFISRWLTKPFVVDGVEIPSNYNLDICIHAINHHPDVWPDHTEFNPRRFEDETKLERDPFSYVPFSAGSRNCIGQNFALNEIKVMIGSLIKRFKISLVEGHVYEEFPELVMRAKNGIKINLEQRC